MAINFGLVQKGEIKWTKHGVPNANQDEHKNKKKKKSQRTNERTNEQQRKKNILPKWKYGRARRMRQMKEQFDETKKNETKWNVYHPMDSVGGTHGQEFTMY